MRTKSFKNRLLTVFLLFFLMLSVFKGMALADAYLETNYIDASLTQPDGFYLWFNNGSQITSVAEGTTTRRLSYNLTTSGLAQNVLHSVVIQLYNSGGTSGKIHGKFTFNNTTGGTFTWDPGVTITPGKGTGTVTPGHGTGTIR